MEPLKNNTVIGLTGGFACGKSSVAAILKSQNIAVVDADQVAREVTAPGTTGLAQVTATFGKTVLNQKGELDRQAMRELAFSAPEKRKQLESILHPLIAKASQKAFDREFKQGQKLVVYEASLLFEAARDNEMAGVLLISASPEVQLKRALKRTPSLSKETAEKIIAAQMPLSEKKKRARWTIENNGSEAELKTKVLAWLESLSMFF